MEGGFPALAGIGPYNYPPYDLEAKSGVWRDSTMVEEVVQVKLHLGPGRIVLEPIGVGKRPPALTLEDFWPEYVPNMNDTLTMVSFSGDPTPIRELVKISQCQALIDGTWRCEVLVGLIGSEVYSRGIIFVSTPSGPKVIGRGDGAGWNNRPAPFNDSCGSAGVYFEKINGLLEALGIRVAVEFFDGEIPSGIALGQNYPNPFNPTTTIRFAVPELGPVKLVVSDMLGWQVVVLVDGVRAVGTHEAVFDGSGLPSGTYLYRLDTLRGVEARRMVLMR